MKLDRAYQLELLQKLSQSYPRPYDIRTELRDVDDEAADRYVANMIYLEQHGLAEARISFSLSGEPSIALPTITHRGMDFLADDGGLTAILGVSTIKLHSDTIKELIEARIAASDMPAPEKAKLLGQFKSLPAEATKHLVMKLLDKSLEAGPAAFQWLEVLIRSLS